MRLGMTRRRLLAETDSRELSEWHAFFVLSTQESRVGGRSSKVDDDLRRVFGKKRKANT